MYFDIFTAENRQKQKSDFLKIMVPVVVDMYSLFTQNILSEREKNYSWVDWNKNLQGRLRQNR